ncbi:hypothetical protein BDQ17DRAFT_1325981 [Cyathus striatus]|nr:hypothetical protein BDQ17DRAFT_1325981 [Cyathus striatus]
MSCGYATWPFVSAREAVVEQTWVRRVAKAMYGGNATSDVETTRGKYTLHEEEVSAIWGGKLEGEEGRNGTGVCDGCEDKSGVVRRQAKRDKRQTSGVDMIHRLTDRDYRAQYQLMQVPLHHVTASKFWIVETFLSAHLNFLLACILGPKGPAGLLQNFHPELILQH